MTATQTQLRRGTSAQCDAMTPAEGEAVVDLTNDRLRLGDGLLAGGIVIPNAYDLQKRSFDAGAAGGTANALTLTLTPAPTGYTTNMAVTFKATAGNTGATTINVNGLGIKDINKVSGGSVVALASGDLVNGGYYTAWYDGTKFIIAGALGSGGVTSVTGSGGVSVSGSTGAVTFTLNTNNALGVGAVALGRVVFGTIAAADVSASNQLDVGYFNATGALTIGARLSGTWRNITGQTLTTGQGGLFIRVS